MVDKLKKSEIDNMLASSDLPTVVFVPGAMHTPAHIEPIISELSRQSYSGLAISRPTIGPSAYNSTLSDDVTAVRAALERLVEVEHRNVILVLHSAGSVSGCQTIHGLEKTSRVEHDNEEDVISCVFIAAFLIPKEKTVLDMLEGTLPRWASDDVSLGCFDRMSSKRTYYRTTI